MAIEFPSDEWMKALMAEINQSESYRKAAKTWEGDLYFIIEAGPGVPQDVYLYLDPWHGECRDAFMTTDPTVKSPEFVIRASLDAWRKVIEKKLDPIRALMTRQLKLKGDMIKIVKNPRVALELVNCCTRIDTSWTE